MSTSSIQIALLRSEIEQLKSRKEELEYYQNQGDNDKRLIWCADLGEIENGKYVGTIEIDREIHGINILPAVTDGAVYDSERDGIASFFGTHNAYYQILNAIISPGYEKWTPQARYAEIYDIDYDTNKCSVNIVPYSSSFLPYDNLDRFENLEQVEIVYPDCNATAFEEGDIVLVQFDDNSWNLPKVKGFKSNPKPCDKEIVYVRLGPLAFIWDVAENTYITALPGIQAFEDCESYLASKTETTITDRLGLPYKKTLLTWHMEADYSDFHDKITTWGLPAQDEDPGFLYDKEWLSHIRFLSEGIVYETTVYDDTISPWGLLNEGYTSHRESWEMSYGFELFTATGVDTLDTFWPYGAYNIICPEDVDEANSSYGTDAEYGNDLPATGYPGCKMSELTYVQVVFSCHAPREFDFYTDPQWTYTGPRETITHCTCSTYPFEIGEAPEDDPQALPLNVDFSAACNLLIEDLHTLWDVTMLWDHPDYWWDYGCPDLDGDPSIAEQCEAGECTYWLMVLNPALEVRIHRK